MLPRPQFEAASSAFARRHPRWQWVVGHRPGYGYLTRTTTHLSNTPTSHVDDDDLLHETDGVEEDIATATAELFPSSFLTIQEYIIYSVSFQVPAFYFTAHDANGTVCSLAELVASSFFKLKLPAAKLHVTDYALTLPSVPFPLLSQGEHPTLGTPCWFFHPCESDTAVSEFLAEVEEAGWSEERRLVRWIELWLMIVGSVLNV